MTTNKHSQISVAAISHANNVSMDRPIFKISVNQNKDSDDKLLKIATWLTSINFRTIQQDTFSEHTPGTGRWLLDGPEYQRWISGHSRLLWAKGLPGAGKTILSSTVIQDLQDRFTSDQSTAIVFAYCRHTDRYSVIDILASFVKQILQDHPSVILPIIETDYDHHQRKETRLCDRDLKDLLRKIFGSFNKTYIIIDALDEFPHDIRDDLLDALSSLQASGANLLLTSRPLELLSLTPDAYVCVEAENQKDIESFIDKPIDGNTRLRDLLKGKPTDRKEICAKLVQKSQGMFLIAALQIDSLKRCISPKKLYAAVDSLSSGLNALYESTWGRIKMQDADEVSLATKAIVWLTYAYRTLKINELQDAVAASEEQGKFDEAEVSPQSLIVSVCCGLVVIDEESEIVRLVHYTAYDFFREYSSGLFATPHTFMTKCCLAFLSASDFVNLRILDTYKLEVFLRRRPLLDYAYSYWGSHSTACHGEGGLPTAVPTFLSQCDAYPHYIRNTHFELMKCSHVAAYYGLLEVLPVAVANEWCNELTQFRRQTPLILASYRGHEKFVKFLLSLDDININLQDRDGQTAIFVASKNGHEGIVKLLLSRSSLAINTTTACADRREKETSGQTALFVASRHGHEAIVKLLLSRKEVDVNMATQSGPFVAGRETALYAASRNGHEGIVKLLLSRKDINVNTTTSGYNRDGGRTALYAACENGHEGIAKLLLSRSEVVVNPAIVGAAIGGHEGMVRLLLSRKDVNINSQDGGGLTVLYAASANGLEEIVKLLLSRDGVDVNTSTFGYSTGHTALYAACENGHEGIAKLLLSRNVVVNPAIVGAANGGHEGIVRLLLSRKGVDINSRHGGRTALFAASEKGHEEIVKLLLSRDGVDVNATTTGRGSFTPLYEASRNGFEGIVKLLLSRDGVDVNATTTGLQSDCTALYAASENGHEGVVKLLLSRDGVDVNATTTGFYSGRTALYAATEDGREEIVKLLLARDDVDVNIKAGGCTALDVASRKRHAAIFKLLRLAQARPNAIPDRYTRRP